MSSATALCSEASMPRYRPPAGPLSVIVRAPGLGAGVHGLEELDAGLVEAAHDPQGGQVARVVVAGEQGGQAGRGGDHLGVVADPDRLALAAVDLDRPGAVDPRAG